MTVLKVITVGNSLWVIFPKEILERLRVGEGDGP
jgi:antitoxin component of MazEF toxin-antitoxin module